MLPRGKHYTQSAGYTFSPSTFAVYAFSIPERVRALNCSGGREMGEGRQCVHFLARAGVKRVGVERNVLPNSEEKMK